MLFWIIASALIFFASIIIAYRSMKSIVIDEKVHNMLDASHHFEPTALQTAQVPKPVVKPVQNLFLGRYLGTVLDNGKASSVRVRI